MVNSYDTWHGKRIHGETVLFIIMISLLGTKNVAKEMKKITEGLVRNKGKTW